MTHAHYMCSEKVLFTPLGEHVHYGLAEDITCPAHYGCLLLAISLQYCVPPTRPLHTFVCVHPSVCGLSYTCSHTLTAYTLHK